MKHSFFDKVLGAAMKVAVIKKYTISFAFMTVVLLTLLSGCTNSKTAFNLDVTDASIFDFEEFRTPISQEKYVGIDWERFYSVKPSKGKFYALL